MNPSLLKLHEISPPPDHPVEAEGDWAAVEEQLGMKLPGDYRSLIETYGKGSFADFLYPISPFAAGDSALVRVAGSMLNNDREMHVEFPDMFPLPVFPDAGGLFPWATTDNGDTLYWLTAGEPDAWHVVVRESRGPEFEVHPFGAAEFLQRWLSGELECAVFPERDEYFDPGFTPFRALAAATVHFEFVAGPFDERLARLMDYLGSKKITHRHEIQRGFLADPSESRMTYTDSSGPYGASLMISYPPADESSLRKTIQQIPDRLGWTIRFVLRNGQQIWPEVPQTSDPRTIGGR